MAYQHGYAPALPSPSSLASPEILGSPFQLRKLLHRHSDPRFSDVDLFEAIDMGEHAAWANLDDPIYAEKDFEIYRPPQQQSSLPVYYVKGWLPYSADTLLNALTDLRYRVEWDKLTKQAYVIDRKLDDKSDLVYMAVNMPWPLASRDYVFQRRTKYFPKQNAFVVISQAAQHALAPEQIKGVVRVETYTMRLSIRSTGTSSCDFYMEYEDDTNFSIPNYVISWMLSVQVPTFMNELRKACANYVTYLKTLDEVASRSAPACVARRRAEEKERRSALGMDAIGSPTSAQSSTDHRVSLPGTRRDIQLGSGSSSELLPRRSLQLRSDGNSDGDLSSSPERARRARKFFQRIRDIDKQRPRKRDILKRPSSLNKLFSSSSSSSSKSSVSNIVTGDELVVEFHEEKIGLHLEKDSSSNRILVVHWERSSEIVNGGRTIEPGMVLSSVNGTVVSDLPASDVLEGIKSATRPLKLGFTNLATARSPVKAKEARDIMRCIFTRENGDLLKLFAPLGDNANIGATLKVDYMGKRVAKKSSHSSCRGDISSRRSPRLKPRQLVDENGGDANLVIIPEGAVLFEIDHCHVSSLPFAEIIHLLSRNAEPKALAFKLAPRPIGDQERDGGGRAKLKRLSMALRWKSGSDDSPMASPGSNKAENSVFKSTNTTDTSSNLSGEATSDPEDMGREETKSSDTNRKRSAVKCLPDYSDVIITTRNIAWAWEQVQLLKKDERVFSAAMLIDKIDAYMMREHKSHVESATVKSVFNKMHQEREWIEQIKERRTLGVKALHEFNNEEEAEWQFGQTYFGVSTHWKPGADGTVWLKLDGLVEGVDIFNTIAVMREIDLFSCWVPFCNQSALLQKNGFVDVLAYISMIFPLLKRDAVIRAVGINACYESRCILLLGGSVDESKLPSNLEVPKMRGWNADRLEMKAFRVLIEPITRTKGRTCIVCNVDPKCPIPKSLLNFSIKKIAGILLFLLRKEAEKIEKAMQDGSMSDHVTRLKADPDGFYAWLRPLFDQWFLDQKENRLPPPLKFPRVSELDVLHEMGRTNSTSSAAASFYSRTSSHASAFLETSTQPDPGSRTASQAKLPASSESTRSHDKGVQHELAKRTWVDYLYDFGIWPYFLLLIFSRVAPDDSFLYVCALKFVFTCTCTWFSVPGAYSWQTRQRKRACRELNTLRKRCVLLAAVYDVLNSWLVRVWVNWLLCYVALAPATCQQRSALEIRESENFWLTASAFTFASVVVGIQVVVNI